MAVLIWPLIQKLPQPAFLQQRPNYTGNRRIPSKPSLPFGFTDRPPVINFQVVDAPLKMRDVLIIAFKPVPAKRPAVVHKLLPPILRYVISGVTRDGSGNPVASCTVDLFITGGDVKIDAVVSDASGNYSFTSPILGTTYYCVAYKANAPDIFGTTVNTLQAS